MKHKDKQLMRQLFVIDNLTIGEIASRLGINPHTAGSWIKHHGLIKRHKDKAWLLEQHNRNLSASEIARLCHSDTSTITRNLAKFSIKSRSISEANTLKWSKDSYKNKLLAKLRSNEHRKKLKAVWTKDYTNHQRSVQSKIANDLAYREANSARIKAKWSEPEFRDRMRGIFSSEEWKLNNAKARAAHPKVSSLQLALYSILDDLSIRHYREYENKPADPECLIGPWAFDCVIPRPNKPTLLIECQGEYFHSIPDAAARDRAKATYISTLPGYELKHIWEHEFLDHNKVVELIKYWLGLTQLELIDFKFSQVNIKLCPATDYRLLLSKYHYLPTAGRGGIAYGAYLEDKLIAVCIFSPLGRQNIKIAHYQASQARELSRLCIHPRYQKKNFGSWFISRCIKALNLKYKCIISYCDKTFGHDGAVYKSANFTKDGIVPPDYWYVDGKGWKMHKRTLYGHAVKMGVVEAEYAKSNGYNKVYGDGKVRYVYER